MDQRSVFHNEWLRSLREQFKQVVRNDDRATLSSLTAVMRSVGFRDDELAQLRIEGDNARRQCGRRLQPRFGYSRNYRFGARLIPLNALVPSA